MKIDRISATVRFSKDIGGSWKSLEIGAEGTLGPNEDWKQEQDKLYQNLTAQVVKLWNTRPTSEPSPQAQEKANQTTPKEEPASPPAHWCSVHQVEFQRYQRGSSTWFAHQAQDGWCREGGSQRR